MNGNGWRLETLFWEATKRCNAHCAFCGSGCGHEPMAGELTTQEILRTFREIAGDTDATRIMINVTGGEPLLRPDLFDVMAECHCLGFPWGMVTNGMLITDEVIRRMQETGMRTISVSLDGLPETHDRLRGVPGSHAMIVAALQKLRAAAFLQHIQVTTVVNRHNIGELEALREMLLPLHLDSWRVAIVDGIGRAAGQDSLLLGTEELRTYLDFIERFRSDPGLPVITSCSHYLGDRDRSLGREPFFCRTGKHVGSILANGDIFVCPNVPRIPELIQGNVRRDRFMQVWQEGFRFFRDPDSRRCGPCRDCPDWPACRGDSLHTWNFDAQEPGFCFRRHFPHSGTQPTQAGIIARLKERYGPLCALTVRYGAEPASRLIFTPDAVQDMAACFHWGRRHPASLSEQMAVLIGHELADATLVEAVSPVFLERRSTEVAAFSARSLHSAQEEVQAINRTYLTEACRDFRLTDTPCQLVGFIHSHPGGLPLAPSEPDVALHEQLAAQGIGWTAIINPQTQRLAAFHGKGMLLGEAMLVVERDSSFHISAQ